MAPAPHQAASSPRITRPPPEINLPRSHSGLEQGMAPMAAPANITAPAKAVAEPAIRSEPEWRPKDPKPANKHDRSGYTLGDPACRNPGWIEDHCRRAPNP